jgi:hypothetical protein
LLNRNARGPLADRDSFNIPPGCFQVSSQLSAECIIAKPTDQLHRVPQPCHCDGLVRSVASGMYLKIRANDSFSDGRNLSSDRHKVSIDTADDDRLLTGHSDSPQIRNNA